DKITLEIALGKIGDIKDAVKAKTDQLQRYSADQEGSLVLSGLGNLFSEQMENLGDIVQGNVSDKVEISSKIKYTYIDMAVKYQKYIEDITNR
ncbi:MAG TPA: hypothetical protein VFD89_01555, partial [Clostridia bacterium]|nr:hypothetical protein [Clostridia bacterium]